MAFDVKLAFLLAYLDWNRKDGKNGIYLVLARLFCKRPRSREMVKRRRNRRRRRHGLCREFVVQECFSGRALEYTSIVRSQLCIRVHG